MTAPQHTRMAGTPHNPSTTFLPPSRHLPTTFPTPSYHLLATFPPLQSQRSIGYNDDSKQAKRDLPLSTLAWRVSPAAFSIFLSVGTSMLVFPFFTYVHTTGLFGDRLAQVCVWRALVTGVQRKA